MLELLVILALLLFCAAAVGIARAESQRRSSSEALRIELLTADHRITSEYHQARRAMNDAAGRSWRNLTG